MIKDRSQNTTPRVYAKEVPGGWQGVFVSASGEHVMSLDPNGATEIFDHEVKALAAAAVLALDGGYVN